jgi:hypothetical protein
VKIVSVEKSYPPRSGGCKVVVYTTPPERAYERIALLEVEGSRAKLRQAIPAIREDSCALGGDAVVRDRSAHIAAVSDFCRVQRSTVDITAVGIERSARNPH